MEVISQIKIVIFFEFIYKKYIIDIMVIKKKRIYKKQKGGEHITQIDRIMIPFFDLIKEFIINNSVAINKDNIIKLCNYIDEKIKYSLFVKLSLYLNGIIHDIDTNTHDTFSLKLVKYLLVEPETRDKFIDKFLKIYIHLLFIRYLFYKDNIIFKDKILTLLQKTNTQNKLITAFLIMSNDLNSSPRLYIAKLERQLRHLFLNDYSKEYGIPVFYGGLLFDSQYNEFVCRQVGASSNKKRNFIINPVLAFAYGLFYKLITDRPEIKILLDEIDKLPKINQSVKQLKNKISMYEQLNSLIVNLFKKDYRYIFLLIVFVIQNFNSNRENNRNYLRRLIFLHQLTDDQKIRNHYEYLYSKIHVPKLKHVKADSQFCIVINQYGVEEIIQPSTFSKCAWHYGCNLKMTPEIRDENISSMYDILRLAQILLLIVLTYGDNIFMDIQIVSEFLVSQYIELFYKKLDGKQSNNRNMNSIRIQFNEIEIRILVLTLCHKYKDLLIQKIEKLSSQSQLLSQKTTSIENLKLSDEISIIDEKLKMIMNELIKFKSLNNICDFLSYISKFLIDKKDEICNNSHIKLHHFGLELQKIDRLLQIFKLKKNNKKVFNKENANILLQIFNKKKSNLNTFQHSNSVSVSKKKLNDFISKYP